MFDSMVQVYRIIEKHYMNGFEVGIHSHNYFHYIYVLDGCGEGFISSNKGEQYFELNKGDLHLSPFKAKHEIAAKKGCNLITVEIKFISLSKGFTNSLMCLPYIIKDIDTKVGLIFKDMLREAYEKNKYYEELINIKFAEALCNILRSVAEGGSIEEIHAEELSFLYCQEDYSDFTPVIRYMKENLNRKVEISELAKLMGFSESYFCTVFKEKFSISPGQYMSNLKLFKAKDLIVGSDLNITQISENLGFASIHYFSRFFKKMTGVSPNEYINTLVKGEGAKLISSQRMINY